MRKLSETQQEVSDAKLEPVIQYRERTGQFFPEDRLKLEPGQTPLEMVYIPSGSFMMGSPENEQGRDKSEGPQHEVTIAEPFFIGKYPITQAQWRAVAALPRIERELDPTPSKFEGDNRPVEQVSWYDAVEFCDRLAQATHRPYRLPSEAEWEYACRAGTTTPFHFGPSITTDLANYRGRDLEHEGRTSYPGNYGDGPHGDYRKQTTDVGSFEGSNAFGLYDMHGNVWEWCRDRWRSHSEAFNDGSALLTPLKNKGKKNSFHVLRGGSWYDVPEGCRSAARNGNSPDGRGEDLGLRVVCAIART